MPVSEPVVLDLAWLSAKAEKEYSMEPTGRFAKWQTALAPSGAKFYSTQFVNVLFPWLVEVTLFDDKGPIYRRIVDTKSHKFV